MPPKVHPRRSLFALFFSPLAAIPYILARPNLFLLAIGPAIVNILLFTGLFFLLWTGVVTPLVDRVGPGDAGFISQSLRTAAMILLFLFGLLITVVTCYLLASVVGSPFYDRMSILVEKEYFQNHPHLHAREGAGGWSIWGIMSGALKRLARALPVFLVLLGVALIPIIGPPLAMVLGFFKTMTYMAMDAFSYSLDRRGLAYRSKLQWLRAHPQSGIGLGSGLAILMLIPCSVWFFPMLAAVAGTREYCRRAILEDGRSLE